MISKVSAWGPTRPEAIARLDRALGEYVIQGITTNIPFLRAILAHPRFLNGNYDTGFLPSEHQVLTASADQKLEQVALIAAAVFSQDKALKRAVPTAGGLQRGLSPWRLGARAAGRRKVPEGW